MTWFYGLRIARKLLVGFMVMLLLSVLLGIFSLVKISQVNKASSDLGRTWVPSIRALEEMKATFYRFRVGELQYLISNNDTDRAVYQKQMDERKAHYLESATAYEKVITEPLEKEIYPQLQKEFESYLEQTRRVLATSATGDLDGARTLFRGESTQTYYRIGEQLDKLIDVNQKGAIASMADAESQYAQSHTLVIGVLVAAIVIGLVLSVRIANIVSKPLEKAVEVARRVAEGDLTTQIQVDSQDETGQLLQALKLMNQNLLSLVSQVRLSTDTIATASTQIASGNMDLSGRTEEQASSLEETASSMEELTSTVRQNADNARQANQLAVSASEVAMHGGVVVHQVVDTMSAINDSSKKIVDIISVIDGIAFQTNILALNAAVEAARAGEQGRGFAVVASEVRSLAQRSAAAAKEIKGLIDTSVEKVDAGSRLVEQAGETMSEIVASVKRVTDIVGEISAASHEQSAGIEQINHAIMQMDDATQQNAALVEQAAAAAQSLQHQAGGLLKTIGSFKIS